MTLRPNLTSFFLIVSALAGNATLGGIDIFLVLAVPVGIVIVLRDPRLARGNGPGLLLGLLALAPLAWRAGEIGIPYFELYWLWPWKAALLALLLVQDRRGAWPFSNDLLLAALLLVLLASARIEAGRMVSLFGPNMLYRFFGTAFVMALVRLGSVAGWRRSVTLGLAGISGLAMILTGSVGAVGVLLAAFFLARDSLWQVLRSSGGFLLAGAALLLALNWRWLLDSNIAARIAYKLENIDRDDRIVGWTELAQSQPGLWGKDYLDLARAWTERSPYPHNIALELFVFYGAYGLAIALATLAAFWAMRRTRYFAYFPLLVIAIGALFSGDLSDNFAVLALPLLVAASWPMAQRARVSPPARKAPA